MTTRNQADDGLSVYGTDGEEYYPDPVDGTRHPAVREWFLSTGLRCHLDTGQPELMVYLGDVRHPRERDQAFAVYEGRDVETVVTDFANAVHRELVENRDWEIVEVSSPSDQKSLFHFLAGANGAGSDLRSRPLSQYTDYDEELFRRSLRASNEQHAVEPIEVVVRDYRFAAELVQTYRDVDPIRIHVYDNQDVQPPDVADLAIKVEPGPYEITIPDGTKELLSSLQRRLESHKATERKNATVEAIATHAEQGDDPEIVREAVEEGFEKYYDSFEVIAARRRNEIESELETKRQELERAHTDLETLQSDFERERRRRKRLERKAKLKEVLESVSGVVSNPLGTGGRSDETDQSEFELDLGDTPETGSRRSWRRIIPILLLTLLIGGGVAVAMCVPNSGPVTPIVDLILKQLSSPCAVVPSPDGLPLYY